MPELRELYQDVILEHSKAPRNYRVLAATNRKAEGFNPLCGDRYTVYVDLDGDAIRDIAFQGSGCAISRASASMMTDSLKGKTTAEAEQLFEGVHRMLTSDTSEPVNTEGLGKLAVLSGVREFPTRVKCASLSWHALRNALKGEGGKVSTE